ncbi:DUF1850 domain-containing protein [Limnochorda pilosa]|uniref:DUF1850 domain-containing protein n=1 Tax=Limnochorda pilosa TaxID=1555112 RepID=A0A0K2SFU6_LIMPI|nr:DUF1850 domain-containing protein [Limnochorda pilosa]BAS25907.1 hypothetical protein LIP_0050 [Limnochorda pilosa]
MPAGHAFLAFALLTLALAGRSSEPLGACSGSGDAVWEVVVETAASEPGARSGAPLLVVPLSSEQPRFGIAFRHSVEHTPVVEWFEPSIPGASPTVQGGDSGSLAHSGAAPDPGGSSSSGLLLVATEYRSFGAGLPTEAPPGARFVELQDRFVIEGMAVPVPDLVLRPLPLTEHALLVGDARYDLTGLAPPGAAVRVRLRVASGDACP